MPVAKLQDYLDENKIKYVQITHSSAYTALEVAESAHFPGKELAKTVLIKIDGTMTMAVLPASYKIDFDLLKKASNAKQLELSEEEEFVTRFPHCEVGAMPPFGNLYNMDVYVDETLTETTEIAFTAGTHSQLIKLSYKDYAKLVKPVITRFAVPR